MRPKHMYAQVSWSNNKYAIVSQFTNLGQKLQMNGYGIRYRTGFRTKCTKHQKSKSN